MAVISRSPTFLAREEWKTIPWSTGSSRKNAMQHLLDLIVDIPAILAQFDSITKAADTCSMPGLEIKHRQTMLWTSMADTERRPRQWKKLWADHYLQSQPHEGPHEKYSPRPSNSSNFDDRLSNFRCRDPITMEAIIPVKLIYPDPEVARTMCWYYAALIILSGVVYTAA